METYIDRALSLILYVGSFWLLAVMETEKSREVDAINYPETRG